MAEQHKLYLGDIDERDEVNGDCQLVRIWCATHRRYERHLVPVVLIGADELLEA